MVVVFLAASCARSDAGCSGKDLGHFRLLCEPNLSPARMGDLVTSDQGILYKGDTVRLKGLLM